VCSDRYTLAPAYLAATGRDDVNVDFPLHVDGRRRTATTDPDDHLRDLIEQVLFTAPGERVMRPDFGSGLLGLVFEPGGPELVATMQHVVQGALQQELGHLITVESVRVDHTEGVLSVEVSYAVLRTDERAAASFSRRFA
jgi:Bacteriophage baseplate protein W